MVKNLKKLRTEQGVSQQALASAIGISQQSVNKYENHSVEPDITTLISIADYFNVTVDYLVGRTEEKNDDVSLTPAEIALLRSYKGLSVKEKTCIDTIIKVFKDNKKG